MCRKHVIKNSENENEIIKNYETSQNNFSNIYDYTSKKITNLWDACLDNHTHSLRIGDNSFYANSISVKNILFDTQVTKMLGKEVDLITISLNYNILSNSNTPVKQSERLEGVKQKTRHFWTQFPQIGCKITPDLIICNTTFDNFDLFFMQDFK